MLTSEFKEEIFIIGKLHKKKDEWIRERKKDMM
jgi:hypothetical protein